MSVPAGFITAKMESVVLNSLNAFIKAEIIVLQNVKSGPKR
jgi:hypothetical protein